MSTVPKPAASMGREAALLTSELAKLAVSQQVPSNTCSESPVSRQEFLPQNSIPVRQNNVKSPARTLFVENERLNVPSPVQNRVLDKQNKISASLVTTASHSTIVDSAFYPQEVAILEAVQNIEDSIARTAPGCDCYYQMQYIKPGFSTPDLFGDSFIRKVPVSGRIQFRFHKTEPLVLNNCAAIQSFRQGGRTLDEPLYGLIKPTIQAVLLKLVRAVGIEGFDPKLLLRDKWNHASAYSFWNTIHVPLGQLLLCKSAGSLAYVLAHEMGHILAAHHFETNGLCSNTENVRGMFISIAQWCNGLGNIGELMFGYETQDMSTNYKVYYAFSRVTEYEADYVGMCLMAKAGFDPREAIAFTRQMDAQFPTDSESQTELTHPSWQNRTTVLEMLMHNAMAIYHTTVEREDMTPQYVEMLRNVYRHGGCHFSEWDEQLGDAPEPIAQHRVPS